MSTRWSTFAAEAPETEAVFTRRLAATGMALLATTRRDGFPRISPLEPILLDERLWLGSMPGSTKSADLRRDGRCCLHTATIDKDVGDGDAKLWGIAAEATDEASRATFAAGVLAASGTDVGVMPGGFDLWRVDLAGGSSLVVGADHEHLRITQWRPGAPERITERR